MININKLNGINRIPYNDKFSRDKIFMNRRLANFHGIELNRLRSPISHKHLWELHALFLLTVATTPHSAACFQIQGFFCRWANLVILVTFLEVNLLHLSSQRDTSPFSSLKLNENKTDYTPSIYCVSFFYYCLAFCTALSLLHDIVIL